MKSWIWPSPRFVGFGVLLLVGQLGGCEGCAPGDPDACAAGMGVFEHADAAVVLDGDGVDGEDFESKFMAEDGSLHTSIPAELIGFGFDMSWTADRPFLGLPELLAQRTFVFQYDFPDVSCTTNFSWSASPEITFPNGYLIVQSPGDGAVWIEMYAFGHSLLDLGSTPSNVRDAILDSENILASNSSDPNSFFSFSDDQNNPGPQTLWTNLSGDVPTLSPGHTYSLFVVVNVAIWAAGEDNGAFLTTGDPITDLTDAGVLMDRRTGDSFGPSYVFAPSQ
ncbi:hypothetical protein ACFL3S_12470 [Gemmatimonadota bacterium]